MVLGCPGVSEGLLRESRKVSGFSLLYSTDLWYHSSPVALGPTGGFPALSLSLYPSHLLRPLRVATKENSIPDCSNCSSLELGLVVITASRASACTNSFSQ